jgi:hypothetical protein
MKGQHRCPCKRHGVLVVTSRKEKAFRIPRGGSAGREGTQDVFFGRRDRAVWTVRK